MADFGQTQRSSSVCGGCRPVQRNPSLINSLVLKDKGGFICGGRRPGCMVAPVLRYS